MDVVKIPHMGLQLCYLDLVSLRCHILSKSKTNEAYRTFTVLKVAKWKILGVVTYNRKSGENLPQNVGFLSHSESFCLRVPRTGKTLRLHLHIARHRTGLSGL